MHTPYPRLNGQDDLIDIRIDVSDSRFVQASASSGDGGALAMVGWHCRFDLDIQHSHINDSRLTRAKSSRFC